MASGDAEIDADIETRGKVLAQRRCIILAIVGATPSSNSSLHNILQNGFLSTVKSWMNDAMNGSVGKFVGCIRKISLFGVACPFILLILFSNRFFGVVPGIQEV